MKGVRNATLAVALMALAGAAVHAADEEPVCKFLLRQIGFSAQRADSAANDVLERAKYLEKIVLMSRNALQIAYPSHAEPVNYDLLPTA
jgi:1-deoxy-D-xylulose 5-phosphate reductoisomerase